MPTNHRKDLTQCKAKAKVLLLGHKHFFSLYLWETQAAMVEQAQTGHEGTQGCCCPQREFAPIPRRTWWRWMALKLLPDKWAAKVMRFKYRVPPKAGELHFIAGEWDLELVAHECFHATVVAIRAYGLDSKLICDGSMGASLGRWLDDPDRGKVPDEELAAYINGELVAEVWKWLGAVDGP